MKVRDLFQRLALGEFSNLAIGEEGTIRQSDYTKVLVYANDALLSIFSRFQLIEKEVLVEQVEHITKYHLKKRFARTSHSNEKYHYIIDINGEPFEEDVLLILECYDSLGRSIILNDPAEPNAYFTPKPDVLQIPNPVNGMGTSVIYQARHTPLHTAGMTDEELLDQEIDIPFFLENALIRYIAYLNYSHMNGQEHIVKSQEYLAMYEAICVDIEDKDLVNQSSTTNHSKLTDRGFV